MPFDPDAYLAKAKADSGANGPQLPQAGFNPDAYLAKAQGQKQEPTEEFSPVRTGVESFANAATAGYLPHLQAAAEPYTDKLFASLEGKEAPEDNTTYVQRRDANIARLGEEAKQNPKSALGGMLAGSVAGGALAGGVLPEIGALGKVGQAALGGGLLGAASNPGDTQGQLAGPQLEERAQNAGIGALTGGVAEKAIGAIQGAPDALKNFAQEKAFKSSGAMLKDFRKAFARDRVNELGQAMIDNGLVKPGMTFDSVAEKAAAIKSDTGKKIGEVYDRLADLANNNPQVIKDALAIADPKTVFTELSAATRDPRVMPKLNTDQYKEAMDKIAEQISSSGHTHDVRYLNDVIGELDSKINWAKRTPEMSDLQQGLLAMRRVLRDKVNSIADRLGGSDEALSQHLKMLNTQYGNMSEISRIAADRTARESANRILSPSDYGVAGIGALIGSQFGSTPEERLKHALMGAGLGGLNKLGRKYGNPVLVQGANAAGNALKPLSGITSNPNAVGAASGAVVNNLRR